MWRNVTLPRAKRALLVVMVAVCGTVGSCGFTLRDVRHNVVAGTAGFVKSYTADFFNAIFPDWDDVLNPTNE